MENQYIKLTELIEMLITEKLDDYYLINQIIRIYESKGFSEEKKLNMIKGRLHYAGVNTIHLVFTNEKEKIEQENPSKINPDGSVNINAFLIPCDVMLLDLMNTSIKAIAVLN